MSHSTRLSNVYYLPATLPRPEAPAPSRWTRARAEATAAWWRLRLTLAEIVHVIRRPPRLAVPDDFALLIGDAVEVAVRPRRRAPGPARVIDLEAARRRRRALLPG